MDNSTISFFFVIGSRKSGTTLLARVLDQHPRIACIFESFALWPGSDASIMNPDSDKWEKHGFNRADVERWQRVWIPKHRHVYSNTRNTVFKILRRILGRNYLHIYNYRKTMTEALSDFARRSGAVIVGDKGPRYIDKIDVLLGAFPGAKYIYNVRDPRGLWNSAQQFRGKPRGDRLLDEMLERDRLISPYLARENFYTLRYEDLVCDSRKTFRGLYEFLGCDFSDEYMRYDPENDPYPNRWYWVPEANQPIDVRHVTKWKSNMTMKQIEMVNKKARWFIDKYNYEL